METINIRKVAPDEIAQLQEISRQTFSETFSADNTDENLNQYLEESFSITKLAAELSNQDTAFYFAELDGKIIGYLKLNRGQAQTELQDEKSIEMERIYVLKAFHGKKVGQWLFEKALEIATKAQADYVWLGVWEKNLRAIHFYKKNGFVEFGKHLFKLGNDEQTDIMMKLPLKDR